ncbi:MAG: hypothetical protein IIZ42_03200 [Eubacterium sp.]|nr:hypothetical protein [Eubacterium sp.]
MDDKEMRFIPPEEQAYEWARKEMEMFFPKPDHFILVNLENSAGDTVNKSLFRKGDEDPVILRVYWPDTDSVKYSVVMNYDDMVEENPGYVGQLILNGQYAFEEALRIDPDHVTELLYGKANGFVS